MNIEEASETVLIRTLRLPLRTYVENAQNEEVLPKYVANGNPAYGMTIQNRHTIALKHDA